MIHLRIDNIDIETQEGSTILVAARNAGIDIPTLCHDERLKPYGSCRMCMVEVIGRGKFLPACTTPAVDGITVFTATPEIKRMRQAVLEMLLLHHPLECPVCDAAGECSLQDYAHSMGSHTNRFSAKRRDDPVDRRAPLIEINTRRCILCGKCIRICDEVQGVHAIDVVSRGLLTVISPAFGEPLQCEFCGQCISVCPVGALYTSVQKNRMRAWFLKNTVTVCNYCGTGCQIELRTHGDIVHRVRAPSGAGVNRGNLCGRGRFGFEFINSDHRLQTPLVRRDGTLQEASWDEALRFAAERLDFIKRSFGGSAIAGIGSARCTNEDNYLFQKFLRAGLQSGNIDSCAHFGFCARQEAARMAWGTPVVPNGPDTLTDADLMLVVESDISDTNPVFALNMLDKKLRGKTRLVSIAAKYSKIVRHSDLWLKLCPGTAISLLNALAAEILPHTPSEVRTVPGFSDFEKSLQETSLQEAAVQTGLTTDEILALAAMLRESRRPVIILSLGIWETTKSADTVLAAANLALLKGMGPDGVAVPAEFANLQGLCDMGVLPDLGPGYLDLSNNKSRLQLEHAWSQTVPVRPGLPFDAWLSAGTVRALYIMGENPLVTFPDRAAVERFLDSLDFLIVQELFLTETARMAHVVLPACSFAEKDGTFTSADPAVQTLHRALAPRGRSRPDWEIICSLSAHLGFPLHYACAFDITREITALVPAYRNAVPDGMQQPRSMLPCDLPRPRFNPVRFTQQALTCAEYPLGLFMGCLLQHSGTLGTYNPGLMSAQGAGELLLSPADARHAGLVSGDQVRIISASGEACSRARVDKHIREGFIFGCGHFSSEGMNRLSGFRSAHEYGVIPVRLEKR